MVRPIRLSTPAALRTILAPLTGRPDRVVIIPLADTFDGWPRSIEELRNVPDGLSRSRWPFVLSFIRGTAFLKLNNGPAATAEFQRIIDAPGERPFSPLYPLAHLNLARALVQTGDLHRARESYERFFELWKDADSDLAPLVEARREFQKLLQ